MKLKPRDIVRHRSFQQHVDDWTEVTVIGSDYQEQYSPSTGQLRHKKIPLERLFNKRRTFEERLDDMRFDFNPSLWTPGPAPKPNWSKK